MYIYIYIHSIYVLARIFTRALGYWAVGDLCPAAPATPRGGRSAGRPAGAAPSRVSADATAQGRG